VAAASVLLHNARLAYRYLVYVSQVDAALETCWMGQYRLARELTLNAIAIAPDLPAEESARTLRRRFRIGACEDVHPGY
jgi:hypothetical protein